MKVLITGPESTGKSTLAQKLSELLGFGVLPDYSRIYLEKYGPDYAYDDISIMARNHHQLYHALDDGDDTILDTYLLNYQIWSQVKYQSCNPWIKDRVRMMKFDTVLLLFPDIDWEGDPLRESKGERLTLFRLYEAALESLNSDYVVIKGTGEARMNAAHTEIIKRSK